MRKITLKKIFFSFYFIFTSYILSFKEWWEESGLLEITNDNFLDYVGKDKYIVLKFYTKWCTYCRIMTPEYDKLNDILSKKRKDVIVARLEGSINEEISMLYNVYSFPQVILFAPGSKEIKSIFKGNRIASVMEKWIEINAPQINGNRNEIKNIEEKNKSINDFGITKQTSDEFMFLKKELLDLRINLEKLQKEIQKLNSFKISNDIEINKEKIDKGENKINEKHQIFDEEMKMKLKNLNENKGRGSLENYKTGDFLILFFLFFFLIGAGITFKRIFFKFNKNFSLETEHGKI